MRYLLKLFLSGTPSLKCQSPIQCIADGINDSTFCKVGRSIRIHHNTAVDGATYSLDHGLAIFNLHIQHLCNVCIVAEVCRNTAINIWLGLCPIRIFHEQVLILLHNDSHHNHFFRPRDFCITRSNSSRRNSIGSFPAASAISSRKDCSAAAMKLDLGARNDPVVIFEFMVNSQRDNYLLHRREIDFLPADFPEFLLPLRGRRSGYCSHPMQPDTLHYTLGDICQRSCHLHVYK